MSRGRHNFKQGDVTKVIAAALKAGLSVARVEVFLEDGRIILIAGQPEQAQNSKTETNEWDSVR
jgi:hypothetical protein